MKKRTVLSGLAVLISVFLFTGQSSAQKVSVNAIAVPDSIIEISNKVFVQQLGKKMFTECLKTDSVQGFKSVYQDGATRLDYTVYYTFAFPGVKEAYFPLVMYYAVYSGKGHLQSGRFLRINGTD